MALTTQFVKLDIDGTIYCIKDFPDIDPNGEPDQVETTTLCDEFHQYIDGLKNYADALEFTANYDENTFLKINNASKQYNPSGDYSVGDYCKHEGITYKCKSAITGGEAWTSAHWEEIVVKILLCNSATDTTGANGKFTINKSEISIRLSGAGVGDVLESVYVIRPKSAIEYASV